MSFSAQPVYPLNPEGLDGRDAQTLRQDGTLMTDAHRLHHRDGREHHTRSVIDS